MKGKTELYLKNETALEDYLLSSPIYKQGFDLRTGACFDDPNVYVPVYGVKVSRGRILVGRCAGSPP